MAERLKAINENSDTRVHWSFWVVGALALIWYVMGCGNFFMQRNPDMLANYPESERAVIEARPPWATVAFAIAVFGGALGSILLLLRKPMSTAVFIISLLNVILTMVQTLTVPSTTIGSPVFIGTLLSLIIAGFLVWYSKWARSQGWI